MRAAVLHGLGKPPRCEEFAEPALGAGRVVAAGRNERKLVEAKALGADSTILLNPSEEAVVEAFRKEASEKRFDVILDYLWGRPTELLLASLTKSEFTAAGSMTRLVQAGESAGPAIKLPAAALRSTGLTILGTGIPPWDVLTDAVHQVMNVAAEGRLRIATERVALEEIEAAWNREDGSTRLVVVP